MACLQDNIDAHGGALNLLRTNSVEVAGIFPYPLEWSNWRDEQRAWAETAVLLNQSFHMSDLYMSGPDAVRLLSDTSVNNWSKFAIGGAKQYVAVNSQGQLIGDSIANWLPDGRVNVAGFEHTLNWLQFQAEIGGYDVQFSRDPSSRGEAGSKRIYRYELVAPDRVPARARRFPDALPPRRPSAAVLCNAPRLRVRGRLGVGCGGGERVYPSRALRAGVPRHLRAAAVGGAPLLAVSAGGPRNRGCLGERIASLADSAARATVASPDSEVAHMTAPLLSESVGALLTARRDRRPIPPLGLDSIDAAYRVQLEQVNVWQAAGGRVAGYKVGLTSVAIQRQLGVD